MQRAGAAAARRSLCAPPPSSAAWPWVRRGRTCAAWWQPPRHCRRQPAVLVARRSNSQLVGSGGSGGGGSGGGGFPRELPAVVRAALESETRGLTCFPVDPDGISMLAGPEEFYVRPGDFQPHALRSALSRRPCLLPCLIAPQLLSPRSAIRAVRCAAAACTAQLLQLQRHSSVAGALLPAATLDCALPQTRASHTPPCTDRGYVFLLQALLLDSLAKAERRVVLAPLANAFTAVPLLHPPITLVGVSIGVQRGGVSRLIERGVWPGHAVHRHRPAGEGSAPAARESLPPAGDAGDGR